MTNEWTVIDLFSGAGGMSSGFSRRPPFRIVAAVDAQHGKPSQRAGGLDCNDTYAVNIGIRPFEADLGELTPSELDQMIQLRTGNSISRGELTVLSACPPCTDFSRAKPANHSQDSSRNSLVARMGQFVEWYLPEFFVMENARELITGNHKHHLSALAKKLQDLGYSTVSEVHMLTNYGLPQIRERAVIIASRDHDVRSLADLWSGWTLDSSSVTVRSALGRLGREALAAGETSRFDPMHQAPAFASDTVRERMEAIPADGGSWYDLEHHPKRERLLIGSMKSRLASRDLGSHPDVYGRLSWDKPSVTIKRECAHVGNGRYAHPEQTRLLSVREMSFLQGFPEDYQFLSGALSNRYRHVGDAVPPLISYQLSALVAWMKTGVRPEPTDVALNGTSLRASDILPRARQSMKTAPLCHPALEPIPMLRV